MNLMPSKRSLASIATTLVLAAATSAGAATLPMPDAALTQAIASPSRTPDFVARDPYRHPLETLSFFGVQPSMTVVEIWPSAGWYTEILAPYLREHGHYVAAVPSVSAPEASENRRKGVASFKSKLGAAPAVYGTPQLVDFSPPAYVAIATPGSVDRVLTFRNVHNWIGIGAEQSAFDAFYAALKPGGVLGVEEHRAKPDTSLDDMKKYGYVTEAYVRQLAEKAGFRFDGASSVNDNPKDRKDYPDGVWTLPPVLTLGEKDRAKYLAIGESDRMTLRFVKPR